MKRNLGILVLGLALANCSRAPSGMSSSVGGVSGTSSPTATSTPAGPNAPYGVDIRWGSSKPCRGGEESDSWVAMAYFSPGARAIGMGNPSIDLNVAGYVGQPGNNCPVEGINLPCYSSMYAATQTSIRRAQAIRVYLRANDSMTLQAALAVGGSWVFPNGSRDPVTVTAKQVYDAGSIQLAVGTDHVIDVRPVSNAAQSLPVCP